MSSQLSKDLERSAQLLHHIEVRYPNPTLLFLLRLRYLRALTTSCDEATLRRHWNFAGFDIARKLLDTPAFELKGAMCPNELAHLELLGSRLLKIPPPRFAHTGLAPTASSLQEVLRRNIRALRGILDESWSTDDDSTGDGWSKIRVPLVLPPRNGNRLDELPDEDPILGRVRLGIRVEMYVRAERLGPFSRGPLLHLDAPADDVLRRKLIEVAEVVCDRPLGSRRPDSRVVFRVRWDLPGARVDGSSIGLPFYLAAAAALADRQSPFSSRDLSNFLAATGRVEATAVLPVSESTLQPKVEAAFYSKVRTLIVPEQQKENAVRTVDNLRSVHPTRQLVVVGMSSLFQFRSGSAFFAGRSRRARDATRHVVREWSSRMVVAVSGLVVATVSVVALLAFLWLHRNEPVDAEWANDLLVTKNRHGRVVGQFSLPPGGENWRGGRSASRGTYVTNLDGTGPNEILTILWNSNHHPVRLAGLDRNGDEIWDRRSNSLGPGTVPQFDGMNWGNLLPVPDPTAPQHLITVRRSGPGSLSILACLDPSSGETHGVVLNHGHLEDVWTIECGTPELSFHVATGTHNPTGSAVAILFQPKNLDMEFLGDSFDELPWTTDSSGVAAHRWTTILMAVDSFASSPRAWASDVAWENGGLLRIAAEAHPGGSINYYFDTPDLVNIELRNVQITDAYKHALQECGHTIPEAMFLAEEDRLGRAARWMTPWGWACSTSSPTDEEL